jgi:hypothetical protein
MQEAAPRELAGIFDHGFGSADIAAHDLLEAPREPEIQLSYVADCALGTGVTGRWSLRGRERFDLIRGHHFTLIETKFLRLTLADSIESW